MFRTNNNWTMIAAALLAIPAIAQQYPPLQQQPYPPDQGQMQYPQQGQYPPQQQQYPDYNPPMANYAPQELDQMVARIALYPDPLLAQVFAAATFPDQIQAAAQWADQHHYLTGQTLANAIQNDGLYFDPSIQALLPFPSVLQMMASDMNWTNMLGNAFLSQGPLLQDAVQRMRQQAYNNGYLRDSQQIRVNNDGPWMEIQPIDPGYMVVPYYDPAVVYYRPYRPGLRFGISFGYGVSIGTWFNPWGWAGNRFVWDRHEMYVNNRVWDRGYIVDRHVGGYRGDGDRRGFEGAGRPQLTRPDIRPNMPQDRRPEYRAPENRGEAGRTPDMRSGQARPEYRGEAGRAPAYVPPTPRPEQHPLLGRSNGERRAAETGHPAPRETHGREERERKR